MKSALVLGAGGFIGSHMVKRLKDEGYFVRGVDLEYPKFSDTKADEFVLTDLSIYDNMKYVITNNDNIPFDEIYQFAADMGGAGYIFTGENDANIMHNSAAINLNLLECIKNLSCSTKIFYSSSACIYPDYRQSETNNLGLKEEYAYPANPDSEYGWEKLFSERLYLSYNKNYNIPIAIARYHNIYGPESTWNGGKEKAPAAICRKVIQSTSDIEIWGDGEQTRSFLYIDECIEATRRLMKSDYIFPINIGSEEMVSINQLVSIAESIESKSLIRKYTEGPTGVRGRNSDNSLIREVLNWDYSVPLSDGIRKTYNWILEQIKQETLS